MSDDRSRATDDERVISSAAPRKGAQISAGQQTASMANQKGTGLIVDGQVMQIQADVVNLMPRSVITIADAPLNEVARQEIYSAELTGALQRDIVAGHVIWGTPSVHTHMHGSIRIPSPYRSRYANRIRELKSLITKMSPLLSAVGLTGLMFSAFDIIMPDLPAPDDFIEQSDETEE